MINPSEPQSQVPTTANRWRDLIDQLTAEQIESLTWAESRHHAGVIGEHPEVVASLMQFAAQYVEKNRVTAEFAHVALPDGATTDAEGWTADLETGGWSRHVEWLALSDDDETMSVTIDGRQKTDGSFTRQISVYGPEDELKLTAAGAYRLAGMLARASRCEARLARAEESE